MSSTHFDPADRRGTGLKVDLVTSASLPEWLRADWDRLAAGNPLNGWAWRSAWWQAFGDGKRLMIAVARCDERIVGITPCYSSSGLWRGRKLRWLGDGKACTDYQRFLIDRSLPPEQADDVVDSLVVTLDGRRRLGGEHDLWELDGMSPDDPLGITMQRALLRRKFTLHAEPLESCWVLNLPDSWDAFKSNAPRALRRKIAKAERRATQDDVQFRRASTPAEIQSAWPEFVRLHELRFRDKVRDGGCFVDSGFARFLPEAVEQLAEQGAARLAWCEVAGRVVSIQLYLLGRRTASMYQSGFDPGYAQLEPGYLLYTRVVQEFIEEGFERLDFLRGNEPYKAAWGASPSPLVRLFAVPPNRLSRWRHQTYQLARSLRQAARNTWAGHSAATNQPAPTVTDDVTEALRAQ